VERPLVIDRCVCEDTRFSALLALARGERLDLAGLARRTGCGTHCGWCVAYINRTLATGEVVFCELLPKEELPPAEDE
jgi:bacterioferritin-associated ferredoxin